MRTRKVLSMMPAAPGWQAFWFDQDGRIDHKEPVIGWAHCLVTERDGTSDEWILPVARDPDIVFMPQPIYEDGVFVVAPGEGEDQAFEMWEAYQ